MIDIATRVYNHKWKIDPIVRSLIDTDFYKLLMCQSVFRNKPDTDVTFSLINRTKSIRLADLIDEGELREQLDLAEGASGLVVQDVDEDSKAYEKGLRAGDLITEAGQQKLASVKDLTKQIEDAKEAGRKSLLLLVRRAGDPRFVALSLADGE